MDCIFCKLAKEPNQEVFLQGEFFYAKYDKNPVVKNHCLIIPKRHVVSLSELNEKEWSGLRSIINKVISHFGIKDFNLGVNEGHIAGRTVDHLHWHIIPRKQGDVVDPTGGIRNIL